MADLIQADVQQSQPKHRSILGLYILIVLVLIVLSAILAVLLWQSGLIPMEVSNPSQVAVPSTKYEWQKSCDDHCAQIVGEAAMARINTSDCTGLNGSKLLMQSMLEVGPAVDSSYWHPKENLQALNDKSASINCR